MKIVLIMLVPINHICYMSVILMCVILGFFTVHFHN